MICKCIVVSEELCGWFVTSHDKMGPFISKERAVNLAEGIAAAFRSDGTPAEVGFSTPAIPKSNVRSASSA